MDYKAHLHSASALDKGMQLSFRYLACLYVFTPWFMLCLINDAATSAPALHAVRLQDTRENGITGLVRQRIFKMHVFALVCVKSDWIGFLIVGFKHLDYSSDCRITCACIHSIRSDRILRSAQAQDCFPRAMNRK